MKLARGTVSVVDKGGQIYQRIWCGYEAYITLMESKPGYCWDAYSDFLALSTSSVTLACAWSRTLLSSTLSSAFITYPPNWLA
jgi:hypothetical protein